MGMRFPWDSHGNGNEKHISMGMGVGMGMISVGVGMSKNIWIRNSILFMYSRGIPMGMGMKNTYPWEWE